LEFSYINHEADTGTEESYIFSPSDFDPPGNCDHEWNYTQVIQDEGRALAMAADVTTDAGYSCEWFGWDALQHLRCTRGSEYLTIAILGQDDLSILWQIPKTGERDSPPAASPADEDGSVCEAIEMPIPPDPDWRLTFDGYKMYPNEPLGTCTHEWLYSTNETNWWPIASMGDQRGSWCEWDEDLTHGSVESSICDLSQDWTDVVHVSVDYDCPTAEACFVYRAERKP
jgi:hypothetical protein